MPILVERVVTIADYLPEGAAVALLDPERSVTRAITLSETNREFLDAAWSAAVSGAETPIDPASLLAHRSAGDFLTLPQLRQAAADRGGVWWTLSAFDSGAADAAAEGLDVGEGTAIRVAAASVPSFQGNVEGATAHVAELVADGWSVVVTASGAGLADRALDVLAERGVAARRVEDVLEPPERGVALVTAAPLERGFEAPDAKLAVLTETEFYGRTIGSDSRVVRRLASRRRNVVDPLQL